MSEYINNVSMRKETIKNVLKQLHEGKSIEEVKAEFGGLASEVSYMEIAEIEQMLIQEGMPVSEIQNLCDVHVAFFRDQLDDQRAPETLSGHPVHTFRAENDRLTALLDEMNAILAQGNGSGGLSTLDLFSQKLEELLQIDRHYLRKENLLFPYLEKYGFTGPSKVMWGLHDQIRKQLKGIRALIQSSPLTAAARLGTQFAEVDSDLREMVYKEAKILFPASLERLIETDWLAIRSQEHEFGYFQYTPGNDWGVYRAAAATKNTEASVASTSPTSQAAATAGELPLDTGLLALDQINLMLKHLPVDVTYVDEHDTVRYFSQSRERIFDRTPSIIGRAVQNCHPPQSVDKVQRILDDFRAGKRETADFWIQMGPRFILIRYFALRDPSGNYRGTLEVSQDATWIRSLEGERRLLDD